MAFKNKVQVTIDGRTFSIMGTESEEYLQKVAAYIDEKMKELKRKLSIVEDEKSSLEHELDKYVYALDSTGKVHKANYGFKNTNGYKWFDFKIAGNCYFLL